MYIYMYISICIYTLMYRDTTIVTCYCIRFMYDQVRTHENEAYVILYVVD